ncbi:hypothetical protein N657DRAFT_246325 [Parathielavia appendiculata]|uniref:Uncharacterized protein n=1 Tax=Parathielavia appendiculata TaxID=2587402 RepID=A0AAN6TSB1_9PEZI|nr:hypothetical protein N657DRAFT_246325 [Parathielavia appendiculata]
MTLNMKPAHDDADSSPKATCTPPKLPYEPSPSSVPVVSLKLNSKQLDCPTQGRSKQTRKRVRINTLAATIRQAGFQGKTPSNHTRLGSLVLINRCITTILLSTILLLRGILPGEHVRVESRLSGNEGSRLAGAGALGACGSSRVDRLARSGALLGHWIDVLGLVVVVLGQLVVAALLGSFFRGDLLLDHAPGIFHRACCEAQLGAGFGVVGLDIL